MKLDNERPGKRGFEGRTVVLQPTTAATLRKTKSTATDPSQLTLTDETMSQLLKMASSTGPVGTVSFGGELNVLSVAGKKYELRMKETARRGQEIYVPAPAAGGGPQLQSIGLCLRQYTQLPNEIVPPKPGVVAKPATGKAKTVATDKPKKGRKRKAASSSASPAKKRKKAVPRVPANPSAATTPCSPAVADPMTLIHCSKYPEIKSMKEYKWQKNQYSDLNKEYSRIIGELNEHKAIMKKKWDALAAAEADGTANQRQKAQKAVNTAIGARKVEIEALYGKAKAINIERKFVADRINKYCKACGVAT